MALFKFRKNADLNSGAQDSAEPVESVEALRKKTLHRLIGSAILVIVGVVIFSIGFDRQPRPIPVDVNIRIPAKDGQFPLVIGSAAPAAAVAPASAASAAGSEVVSTNAPAASAVASAPVPALAAVSVAPVAPVTAAPAAPAKPVEAAKAVEPPKPVAAAPAKPESKPAAPSEAERAKALLEGKSADAQPAASGERFIVQVGAFADVTKARQARLKLEKAGLKTYTQVAQTSEGKRIRVRVGPFASRAEAEKAASKIKTLDLPAAILTL